MPSKVELGIYEVNSKYIEDLSSNGIPHTTIIVFNREFEFSSQGLTSIIPAGTSFKGLPNKVINMGVTEIDEETFKDYLEGLRNDFHASRFNKYSYNGNKFSEKTLEFLNGSPFPAFLKQIQLDPLGVGFNVNMNQPTQNVIYNPTNLGVSSYNSVNNLPPYPTINIISLDMLRSVITTNYRSILMTVSPYTTYSSNELELSKAFYELSIERGQPGRNVGFMRLDLKLNKDIAQMLGLNDLTPTSFVVFKNGAVLNIWQDNNFFIDY
ncbi:hypothetical protein E3Q05_00644 [Wallemia mellicola]|nr:hypothetical protein E3Q05_00644 [Wallemia mellicola]